jgi:hypothetical protein
VFAATWAWRDPCTVKLTSLGWDGCRRTTFAGTSPIPATTVVSSHQLAWTGSIPYPLTQCSDFDLVGRHLGHLDDTTDTSKTLMYWRNAEVFMLYISIQHRSTARLDCSISLKWALVLQYAVRPLRVRACQTPLFLAFPHSLSVHTCILNMHCCPGQNSMLYRTASLRLYRQDRKLSKLTHVGI